MEGWKLGMMGLKKPVFPGPDRLLLAWSQKLFSMNQQMLNKSQQGGPKFHYSLRAGGQ